MAIANGPGGICPAADPDRVTYVPSSRKDAAKSRLRKYKRNRTRWLADRSASFAGETFLVLLESGRARRFEFGHHVEHELRRVLSPRAVELLGVVVACERGFGGHRGGVRLSHAISARILHCSERTAGDAMRELAKVGLVEPRWHFTTLSVDQGAAVAREAGQRGCYKHRERVPAYVSTKRARSFCARRTERISRSTQVGKNYQPGRTHQTSGLSKRRSGVERPEQAFVADVLRARQRPTTKPPVAKVIERLPDGRIALGSPLRSGVGRLAKARIPESGRARAKAEDALFEQDPVAWAASFCPGAWAALDEKESGGGGS